MSARTSAPARMSRMTTIPTQRFTKFSTDAIGQFPAADFRLSDWIADAGWVFVNTHGREIAPDDDKIVLIIVLSELILFK
jgi:hypothetical protein